MKKLIKLKDIFSGANIKFYILLYFIKNLLIKKIKTLLLSYYMKTKLYCVLFKKIFY